MARITLGKRILALAICVAMCLGTLQITASAQSVTNQVMDGYYVLNEDHTVNATTPTAETEQDGFTVSKTIQQTGLNAFDVTLTVKTQQTVTTSRAKAATVLVIDLSNSMNDRLGSSTRMAEARKVAQQFLESYAGTDAEAEQYLSVVWFGTYSGVDQDWVNVAGGQGQTGYNRIDSYLEKLTAPHSSDTGGTNLDAGLSTALAQLAKRANIQEQKNVVLITDGKPTYYYNESGRLSGAGNAGSKNNNDAAAAEATAIKASGATIYTVCLAAESDVCYTGNAVKVCEHCQKTKDQHHKAELCRECGHSRDEHNAVRGRNGRISYYCTDNNGEQYDGRTHYFCDATQARQYKETTISNGNVTVGYFLSNDIATSSDTAFNANTISELEEALKAIAAEIESSGNTGAGTTVTDPMGQYIVLGDISALSGATATDSGLIWELDETTLVEETVEGNTTKYTYQIKYPITLDTAAKGFQENNPDGSVKYYPANGYTYLSVEIDGQSVKIPFNVPGVCGQIPAYNWKIEYYLENAQGSYTREETQDMGAADLHTSVSAPSGYATKYAGRSYVFASGNTTIQIAAGENVMRLYYDRQMADVTVNHFYKTDLINADGTEIKGEYPANPQVSSTEAVWVNTLRSAAAQTTYGGVVYQMESVDPRSGEITVSANSSENVINFYYSRVEDRRADTSAQVKHIYNTYGYVLENGRFVLRQIASVTETAQSNANLPATSTYVVNSDAPLAGYTGFSLNTEKGDYNALRQPNGTLSFVLAESADANVRTLVFEKTVDNREPVKVTVNHYYTKTTTSVVDGQVVTTVAPNNELGKTDTFTGFYAGETFAATQANTYENDLYVSNSENYAKCAAQVLTGNLTVNLYYNLTVAPAPVTFTVNHRWNTYTMTVNAEGKAGYWNAPVVETAVAVAGMEGYAGQQVTLPTGDREGFAPLSDNPAAVQILKEAGNTWTFVYEKYVPLGQGSITVNHHYKTTTIAENGTASVETEDVLGQTTGMYLGEQFLAESLPGSFQLIAVTENGEAVAIQNVSGVIGGDHVVDFYYEKTVDNSRMVDYSISHIYNLYTYNGQLISSDRPEPITGSGFVTTQVTAAPSPSGYTQVSATYNGAELAEPYTIALADGENAIVFVYEKYEPREKLDVSVIHNYYESADAITGGTANETYEEKAFGIDVDSVYTAEVRNVEGYEFHSADPDTLSITVTKDGRNVIVINYVRTVQIEEEEVPLAPAPVEPPVIEIPDEEVPLADVPKTGDASFLYTALTAMSGIGLAALGLKKKEEETEE